MDKNPFQIGIRQLVQVIFPIPQVLCKLTSDAVC